MTTMKSLALAVGLFTSVLATPFDYERYDLDNSKKFKSSTYFKHLRASYQYTGSKDGDAILTRKGHAIVWEWKDGVCSSVSEYFMHVFGEYEFAGTSKCSFKQGDVMDVAELFFNEDGIKSFMKKYGATRDPATGGWIKPDVAESPPVDEKVAEAPEVVIDIPELSKAVEKHNKQWMKLSAEQLQRMNLAHRTFRSKMKERGVIPAITGETVYEVGSYRESKRPFLVKRDGIVRREVHMLVSFVINVKGGHPLERVSYRINASIYEGLRTSADGIMTLQSGNGRKEYFGKSKLIITF
jgi:hypothetical protein